MKEGLHKAGGSIRKCGLHETERSGVGIRLFMIHIC